MVGVMVLFLMGGMARSATAAPARSVYHDPAFTFTYPTGWTLLSTAAGQQVRALLGGLTSELHVTDVGGVQDGSGPTFGGVVLVTRLRLTHSARLQVLRNRTAFMTSLLNGIALSTRRVLHRGATTIGGRRARTIEFIQGGGSVRLHQKIDVVLSSDDKRLFLVYFIARKKTWNEMSPLFASVASSMRFAPAG
jgi:hypothetical protein